MRRVVMGAAILVAVTVTGRADAQGIKMDVPAGLTLSTVNEPAPKKENKDSKESRGFFKDLRPGSCRVTTNPAPVSSWPARGEPLVSVCRP
jgi:hypothetical protein